MPTSVRGVRRIAALAAALTLAVALAGPAVAAKPGGGGSTTTGFRIDDGRFASTTTAYKGSSSSVQWVRALCYQSGALVYEQYLKFGTATTVQLTLGPTPSWTSGSASCKGEGGYFQSGRWRVAVTTTFNVAG